MNGPVRQSMQPNIQQQPFPQQPMGILAGPQQNRAPYPPQQPRGNIIARPPHSAPPPNPSANVPSFPGLMGGPQQPPPGPGGVRRAPSQPHMSMLGGMSPAVGVGVAGGMAMGMGGLGPQTTLPLRQGQPQNPQQALQHQQQQHQQQQQQQQQAAQNQQQAQQQQLRMQQQQQHHQQQVQAQAQAQAQAQQAAHMLGMHPGMPTPDMGLLRGQPSAGGLGGGGIARTPSAQSQIMASLSQPPTPSSLHPSALGAIGGMGMGMPPPHHGVGTVPSVSPRQRTGAPSPRPGAMPPTHQHPHPNHPNPYAPHANAHNLSMSMGGVFNPPMNIGPTSSPGHTMMGMQPPPSSTNPLGMPPSSSAGSMGMPPQNNGMPPAHHPQRTPRMTPDNAAMTMGMYNPGRPGSMGGGPGGPGAVGGGVGAAGMYGSGPFGGPSTPQMGMVGVTGNEGVAQGGTPNRTSFLHTPAQAYEMMNAGANSGNGGGNTNGTSSNAANGGGNATNGGGNPNTGNNEPYFSMPPPSGIPRPPSHATNPNPGAQTPQQAHQQALASQQAAHHQHQINAQAAQHQHAMNQQQQHGQLGQQPHHPSHAHGHPPHQLNPPHMSQQQQHAQQQHAQQQQQQHALQQHAQQQQQQHHGSPPGNDVRMGTPVMHPPRPQSQPQRPPSQASRTPRAGPTPIPGAGPGVGGPQHSQQHPGGAPPPPGVSASSSSSSSSVGGGAPGPSAPNGAPAPPGAHPLSSGPSTLGSTPLTQTGMRAVPQPPGQGAVPMHGMGAFAAMMPGMNMNPMGGAGGMHPHPHPGGLMGGIPPATGGAPPPPPPPNGHLLGGVANAAPRPGGGGGPGAAGAGTGGPGGGAGPGAGPSMAGAAPAGPGVGGAAAAGAASAPPLQRAPLSTAPTVGVGMGQGVIRLLQFSGILSNEMKTQKLQLHWWGDLVKEYFTPKAVMKLTLWRDSKRNEAKPFEIGVPILPRFFLVTTQSGVKSMSFTIDGARERTFGQNHSVVECVSAVWTYRYTNGYTVTLRGPLTVHVIVGIGPGGTTLKFEDFQFDANLHDKFVAIDAILGTRAAESTEQRIASMHAAAGMQGGAAAVGMDGVKQEEEDAKWDEPRILIERAILPGEPVNAFGIPQATMRCLELAESVSSMADLIAFAHEHKMGPKDSLKVMAQQIRDNGYSGQGPPSSGGPPAPSSGPPNPASAIPGTNTSLGASFSAYQPPGPSPSGTLYSSAPPSVTNPTPGASSSMNSPGTASSSANSPEKQLKTIPQQQQDPSQQQGGHPQASGSGSGQQQQQGQPAASASSPAISSGGTTNTPALSNTSLKRKQAGDASSPTVGNPDQPPKRVSRKRVRAGTTGAG